MCTVLVLNRWGKISLLLKLGPCLNSSMADMEKVVSSLAVLAEKSRKKA